MDVPFDEVVKDTVGTTQNLCFLILLCFLYFTKGEVGSVMLRKKAV